MSYTTISCKALALIRKCEKAADRNEYRCSKINGVGNLSRSDLDSIVMYCQEFIKHGDISAFMEPRGGIGEVLAGVGILHTSAC